MAVAIEISGIPESKQLQGAPSTRESPSVAPPYPATDGITGVTKPVMDTTKIIPAEGFKRAEPPFIKMDEA